jgi:hypothetical protein
MTVDVFFPIVDGAQLESAVINTLQDWFSVYSREFEVQRGLAKDTFPHPRAWVISEEPEKEGGHQTPSIVVVSPGLNGDPPGAEGDGQYRAAWMIGVGAFVSANTREATRKLAREYAAIIRAIMLQKQGLDGSIAVNHVRWLDESYDDNFQFTDTQTISFAQVVFDVEVDNVLHRYEGPVGDPDDEVQPGMHWEAITSTEIIVEAKEE